MLRGPVPLRLQVVPPAPPGQGPAPSPEIHTKQVQTGQHLQEGLRGLEANRKKTTTAGKHCLSLVCFWVFRFLCFCW